MEFLEASVSLNPSDRTAERMIGEHVLTGQLGCSRQAPASTKSAAGAYLTDQYQASFRLVGGGQRSIVIERGEAPSSWNVDDLAREDEVGIRNLRVRFFQVR